MAVIDFKDAAEKWNERANYYASEGRALYVETLKSYSTVAVALLGFNVIWLQITKNPTKLQKCVFLASIISLALAMVMGIAAQIDIIKHLNRVSVYYQYKNEAMTKYMLRTGKLTGKNFPIEVDEYGINHDFRPWQEIAQSILLGLGILLSVYLAYLFVS